MGRRAPGIFVCVIRAPPSRHRSFLLQRRLRGGLRKSAAAPRNCRQMDSGVQQSREARKGALHEGPHDFSESKHFHRQTAASRGRATGAPSTGYLARGWAPAASACSRSSTARTRSGRRSPAPPPETKGGRGSAALVRSSI